jgi:hypothetical protein
MPWFSFLMGESLCANLIYALVTLTDFATRRIRNYIGKEWFLDLALKGKPSPLSYQIKDILGSKKGSMRSRVKSSKL